MRKGQHRLPGWTFCSLTCYALQGCPLLLLLFLPCTPSFHTRPRLLILPLRYLHSLYAAQQFSSYISLVNACCNPETLASTMSTSARTPMIPWDR